MTHDYSKPVSEDDEVLSVAALFQPLKQETMTKDLDTWVIIYPVLFKGPELC